MRWRWLAVVIIVMLMAACAPVRIKGNANTLEVQAAREKALAGHDHWTLQAHLGVSDGHHGGSGTLVWVQDGQHYSFTVRAPITGRSFRLVGGPDGAVLEGLDGGPVHGADAQALLARVLGWRVPMQPLKDWVRGLRAGGAGSDAVLRFGNDGLPSLLVQDGWTVQYRDWFTHINPALPRKVFAANGQYHVRLAIRSWSIQ
ncbi:MAG TPA: lipoprotein insertase outer membrane protein LolB [Rhodanobacteraceae bacterium]